MASSASGNRGAAAAKQLRVLLPFSKDRLRIPDELADEIGAAEALVVSPGGGKGRVIWPVGLGRDGGGAFLGRGWPQFAAAHGVGDGWHLALRHRGRGLLTVKAFDDSCCIRYEGNMVFTVKVFESDGCRRKPKHKDNVTQGSEQEISGGIPKPASPMGSSAGGGAATAKHPRVLLPFTSDTLRIPDELGAVIGAGEALVVGPTAGKVKPWRVESGGTVTARSWGAGGRIETKATTSGKGNRKLIPAKLVEQYIPNEDLNKHTAIVLRPLGKVSHIEMETNQSDVFFAGGWSQFLVFHDITEANALLLRYEGNMVFTALPAAFCDAIGLHEPCMIALKTSMSSVESWQVLALPFRNGQYRVRQGWMRFCKENNLNVGDIYTFNIVKSTLWLVIISRYNERMNQCYSLPLSLCKAIGLRDPCCMVTLKTSASNTMSWQAHVLAHENGNQMSGSGWKRFCHDNGIKVGDVCTIKIIETTLWHVIIERRQACTSVHTGMLPT
ncbi:hypothetical protein HU200_042421 [Digitaria exilis]|uniref:TF-B3 domain-containing protein n=1 Tax=Digitaria exilis TaxID=1010633 RepID=A0A835BDH6_9POAL|nr:hypothetical protein HU200_042421 [Digitaria exilis]